MNWPFNLTVLQAENRASVALRVTAAKDISWGNQWSQSPNRIVPVVICAYRIVHLKHFYLLQVTLNRVLTKSVQSLLSPHSVLGVFRVLGHVLPVLYMKFKFHLIPRSQLFY